MNEQLDRQSLHDAIDALEAVCRKQQEKIDALENSCHDKSVQIGELEAWIEYYKDKLSVMTDSKNNGAGK